MRLLVELEVPDGDPDARDPVNLAQEMLTAWGAWRMLPRASRTLPYPGVTANTSVVGARRVDPGWSANMLTRVLTKVGYLNPTSGVLHRPKMDLLPRPQWVPVFLYDPFGQFAQADGGAFYDTLGEAFDAATGKVTFTLHTGERVRLVREQLSNSPSDVAWVFRPIGPELQRMLLARGLPADVVRAIAENDGDPR